MNASKNLKRWSAGVLSNASRRKIGLCGFGLSLALLAATLISAQAIASGEQGAHGAAPSSHGHVDPSSPSQPTDVPAGIALVSFQGQCDHSQNVSAEKTC